MIVMEWLARMGLGGLGVLVVLEWFWLVWSVLE